MGLRRLLVALVTNSLVATSYPAGADVNNPLAPNQRYQVVSDSWDPPDEGKFWLNFSVSGTQWSGPVNLQNLTTQQFCKTTDIRSCVRPGQDLSASGYASFCAERKQIPCIEKVEFRKADSEPWVEGSFLNYLDTTPSAATIAQFQEDRKNEGNFRSITTISQIKNWKDNPSIGLMGTVSGPMLISAPGFESNGTSTYIVEHYWSQLLANIRTGKPRAVYYDQFVLNVRPVVEKQYPDVKTSMDFTGITNSGQVSSMGVSVGDSKGGYKWVDGRVVYAAAFDPAIEVRVILQTPSEVGGWFHSRLSGPDLQLSRIDAKTNRLVISGKSIEVPITSTRVEAFAPENKKYLKYLFGDGNEDLERIRRTGQSGGTGALWDPAHGTEPFEFWFSKLDPKAKGKISTWTVGRMSVGRLGDNRCLNKTDRIQGLINTNAMVYQSKIPEFRRGFLNYQIAGVHLNMDGEVFRGEYDLIMRSDAARCLYGFSKAPVSGTLTVVDAKGKTEVSTTTLGEKNGWLRLSAKNFTFSKKTIRLKLTQRN